MKMVMLLIFISIDVNKSKYLKNYLKNTFYVLKKCYYCYFFNCVEAKTKRKKKLSKQKIYYCYFFNCFEANINF